MVWVLSWIFGFGVRGDLDKSFGVIVEEEVYLEGFRSRVFIVLFFLWKLRVSYFLLID